MSTKTQGTDLLAFWQQRTSRELTEDDAREIMETLYELYAILHDWYVEDLRELQSSTEGEVS